MEGRKEESVSPRPNKERKREREREILVLSYYYVILLYISIDRREPGSSFAPEEAAMNLATDEQCAARTSAFGSWANTIPMEQHYIL